jgi:anti-sigma factor RsiW
MSPHRRRVPWLVITMGHRRVRRSVERLADDELPAAARPIVLRHLADCGDCRGELELLIALKHSLRRSSLHEPTRLAAVRLRRFAERLSGAQ